MYWFLKIVFWYLFDFWSLSLGTFILDIICFLDLEFWNFLRQIYES
jgi:hypothetical protein